MTQHTPGPLFINTHDEIVDRRGLIIADCVFAYNILNPAFPPSSKQYLAKDDGGQANREHIVRAWNSYEPMLEALKHAHNSLRTFRNVPKEEQEWTTFDDDVMKAIEAAIAKAEGKED